MINLNRLRKDEIIWLSKHNCRHKHTFLQHPNCIETEKPNMCPVCEKVAALDCETTGLNGNWDYVISYGLYDGKKIYGRVLTEKEVLDYNLRDKELLREFYDNIMRFDRVVVYWGKDRRHDLPFLRTRAVNWELPFPIYKEIYVTDLYDIAKNKLRLHRNRLENVAQFLRVPAKQHRLDGEIWGRAKLGNRKALNFVWLHNTEDCKTTWEVYQKLKDFVKETKTSI